jgi:hypothetical protein
VDVWLLTCLISLVLASLILGWKNRRSVWWVYLLAIVLGPVGVWAAASLKAAPSTVAAQYKRCPFCASRIRREAIVCGHCGRDIAVPPRPQAEA